MAGQGTGLPTASGSSITPNVDLRSYGAGEAAAADAFNEAARGLGRLVEAVEPAAQQAAAKPAAAPPAAAPTTPPPPAAAAPPPAG